MEKEARIVAVLTLVYVASVGRSFVTQIRKRKQALNDRTSTIRNR